MAVMVILALQRGEKHKGEVHKGEAGVHSQNLMLSILFSAAVTFVCLSGHSSLHPKQLPDVDEAAHGVIFTSCIFLLRQI